MPSNATAHRGRKMTKIHWLNKRTGESNCKQIPGTYNRPVSSEVADEVTCHRCKMHLQKLKRRFSQTQNYSN